MLLAAIDQLLRNGVPIHDRDERCVVEGGALLQGALEQVPRLELQHLVAAEGGGSHILHEDADDIVIELAVVKVRRQHLQDAVSGEQKAVHVRCHTDLPMILEAQGKDARLAHALGGGNKLELAVLLGDNTRVANGAIEQTFAIVHRQDQRRIELACRLAHGLGLGDHGVICLDHRGLDKCLHLALKDELARRSKGAEQVTYGGDGDLDGGLGTDIAMAHGTQTVRDRGHDELLVDKELVGAVGSLPDGELLDATGCPVVLAAHAVVTVGDATEAYTRDAEAVGRALDIVVLHDGLLILEVAVFEEFLEAAGFDVGGGADVVLEAQALRVVGAHMRHGAHAGTNELVGLRDRIAVRIGNLEPHAVSSAELGKLVLGVVAVAKGKEVDLLFFHELADAARGLRNVASRLVFAVGEQDHE